MQREQGRLRSHRRFAWWHDQHDWVVRLRLLRLWSPSSKIAVEKAGSSYCFMKGWGREEGGCGEGTGGNWKESIGSMEKSRL